MFNPNFNPAQVMLRGGASTGALSGGGSPYLNTGKPDPKQARPNVIANKPSIASPANPNVLGAQAVRSTGSGPFDQGYRQDLATYAGGNFARPGGSLSFDPTGSLFGNPTGGGSAPVSGMPTNLLTQALGGQGFSAPPPTAMPSAQQKPWWQQMMESGQMFGKGRFLGN